MSWLYLFIAIVLEVCGTTCMKLSQGFTKVIPSVLIFVFYGLSFAFFPFCLKTIDISIAYAVWAGIGILLIAGIGIVWFGEPITHLKIFSTILVIAGVAGLTLGTK